MSAPAPDVAQLLRRQICQIPAVASTETVTTGRHMHWQSRIAAAGTGFFGSMQHSSGKHVGTATEKRVERITACRTAPSAVRVHAPHEPRSRALARLRSLSSPLVHLELLHRGNQQSDPPSRALRVPRLPTLSLCPFPAPTAEHSPASRAHLGWRHLCAALTGSARLAKPPGTLHSVWHRSFSPPLCSPPPVGAKARGPPSPRTPPAGSAGWRCTGGRSGEWPGRLIGGERKESLTAREGPASE
eukprot:2121906-Rhodomonas_salina.3